MSARTKYAELLSLKERIPTPEWIAEVKALFIKRWYLCSVCSGMHIMEDYIDEPERVTTVCPICAEVKQP